MTSSAEKPTSKLVSPKKRFREEGLEQENSDLPCSENKKIKREYMYVLRRSSEVSPSLPIPTIVALYKKPSYIIGRAPGSCDIVLDSIQMTLQISRAHAEIRPASGSFYIRDTNSLNGTFLNGRKITSGWQKLQEGDKVCFGPYYNTSEFFYTFERMLKEECPSEAFEYGRSIMPEGHAVPYSRGFLRQPTLHLLKPFKHAPAPSVDEIRVTGWKAHVEKVYENAKTNILKYKKRTGWFISYKQQDGSDVLSERLYNQLSEGEENWHDMYKEEKRTLSTIMKAICRRDKFICFLSANYFNDKWCVYELTTAFLNGVVIVPVFNENKSPSGAGPLLNLVPPCFSKLKENDFVGLSKDMVSCAGQILKIKTKGKKKVKAEFSDSEQESEEERFKEEDEIIENALEDEEL